jgi:hypothetical protein
MSTADMSHSGQAPTPQYKSNEKYVWLSHGEEGKTPAHSGLNANSIMAGSTG